MSAPSASPEARLAEAIRIHDDDPWAARNLLLPLAGQLTAPDDLARLASFATHVIGGLLKRWPEALTVCRQAVEALETPRPEMLRSLAVCATLAGDALQVAETEATMALLLTAHVDDCNALIRLLVIEHDLSPGKFRSWRPYLDRAVARAEQIEGPPELLRFVAITANNSASSLAEWLELPDDDTCRLIERIAQLSFRCWTEVGTWVNHERAHYLMALVLNTACQPKRAAEQARLGLAIIEANGPEPIDKCFLLLALARSLKSMGDKQGSFAAAADAAKLAVHFDTYWQAEFHKHMKALEDLTA